MEKGPMRWKLAQNHMPQIDYVKRLPKEKQVLVKCEQRVGWIPR